MTAILDVILYFSSLNVYSAITVFNVPFNDLNQAVPLSKHCMHNFFAPVAGERCV